MPCSWSSYLARCPAAALSLAFIPCLYLSESRSDHTLVAHIPRCTERDRVHPQQDTISALPWVPPMFVYTTGAAGETGRCSVRAPPSFSSLCFDQMSSFALVLRVLQPIPLPHAGSLTLGATRSIVAVY
ncbi:hypothetical protein PLICRDRAFT_243290 [Plicaturopsis crispa FD-325 SS-3]|nr:hypothetical protein PLICRDRAFT_243290 [Plicaturopsis crispa FD-325 SS-3]